MNVAEQFPENTFKVSIIDYKNSYISKYRFKSKPSAAVSEKENLKFHLIQ